MRQLWVLLLIPLLAILTNALLLYLLAHNIDYQRASGPEPLPISCDVNRPEAVARFARFIQYKTVGNSSAPDHVDEASKPVFLEALAFLKSSYPLVWSTLVVEEVGAAQLSLLLQWKGSRPDLLPVLYISHYDVVPISSGTEGNWVQPPFSGATVDGCVGMSFRTTLST